MTANVARLQSPRPIHDGIEEAHELHNACLGDLRADPDTEAPVVGLDHVADKEANLATAQGETVATPIAIGTENAEAASGAAGNSGLLPGRMQNAGARYAVSPRLGHLALEVTKINLEPRRVALWLAGDGVLEHFDRDPLEAVCFFGICQHRAVEYAAENMHKLMLG